MNQAMDRLSGLPDSVIHRIFSFLPMVDVVRTTVLSQRWKDLWTTVPWLEFIPVSDKLDKFRDFVYRTLMLFRGSKIQRFRTCAGFSCSFLCPDQNLWVRFAVEHEVEELQIFQSYNQETPSLLPQCLFSSSSIRKLLLCGYDIVFQGNICWDRLKSLRILHKRVDQFVVDNVLSGSPQLEILDVCCDESVNICSTILKNLSIRYYEVDYSSSADDDEIGSTPHIQTPNLEVLRVSGSVCKKGLFIVAPRLIKATLDLHYGTYDLDYELHWNMLRDIFQCIDHVQELTVRDWCIMVLTVMSLLTVMKKTALPSPLLNVKHLTVNTSHGKDCPVGFVDLLKISPNVSMLSIENSYPSFTDEELEDELWYLEESVIPGVEFSDSVLTNLRILDVKLYNYSRSVFSLAKLVLKSASALEKIVIRVFESSKQVDVVVGEIEKLLKMPRPSPNADVVLRKFKCYI